MMNGPLKEDIVFYLNKINQTHTNCAVPKVDLTLAYRNYCELRKIKAPKEPLLIYSAFVNEIVLEAGWLVQYSSENEVILKRQNKHTNEVLNPTNLGCQ